MSKLPPQMDSVGEVHLNVSTRFSFEVQSSEIVWTGPKSGLNRVRACVSVCVHVCVSERAPNIWVLCHCARMFY